AADARAHRVHVPVNLRVVGGFVAGEVAPQKENGDQNHEAGENEPPLRARTAQKRSLPLIAGFAVQRGRGFQRTRFRLRFGLGYNAAAFFHWLLPFQVFANALFGASQGAGKGNLGQVVKVEARDKTLVRSRHSFLRLHHFQVVGDSGGETV